MQRVLVLGSPGAGKSTFARRLGAATGLPVVHLDKHYWRPGWIEPGTAEWRDRVAAIAAAPRWIIDGNYGGTLGERLAAADTAVMLDIGRWRCLSRVASRTWRDLGRVRDDMAAGCRERFDLDFLRYVWTYPRDHRPHFTAALAGFAGATVWCRSDRDADLFLAQARAAAP